MRVTERAAQAVLHLPSGDRLVLLSLEIWSDWSDLRHAVAYATPEPEGELPRPPVQAPPLVVSRVVL